MSSNSTPGALVGHHCGETFHRIAPGATGGLRRICPRVQIMARPPAGSNTAKASTAEPSLSGQRSSIIRSMVSSEAR
jgi:hypothetical protein